MPDSMQPERTTAAAGAAAAGAVATPGAPWQRTISRRARTAGITMGVLVSLDLVLGVAALVAVPYDRPDAVLPAHGKVVYLAHAVLGALLGAAAVAIVPKARRMERPLRLGAVTGLVGIGVAALGGMLATIQSLRLVGMGLMLVGAVTAEAGYLMPLIDSAPPAVQTD